MDKVVATAQEAVADIVDGATLAVGGFGICGVPIALIDALLEQGARDLTSISNNCGVDDEDWVVLLYAGRISRTISSFVGGNKELARLLPRPASWRSSSPRRARSPSGCAPAAPASRPSTRRPASGRWSPRAASRSATTPRATW